MAGEPRLKVVGKTQVREQIHDSKKRDKKAFQTPEEGQWNYHGVQRERISEAGQTSRDSALEVARVPSAIWR